MPRPSVGKIRVNISMSPDKHQLFKRLAAERDMSLSTWLVQAGLSYQGREAQKALKRRKAGELELWPSGWPKAARCWYCKLDGHDPKEVHGFNHNDYDLQQAIEEAKKAASAT